jgi:hypothetical protein
MRDENRAVLEALKAALTGDMQEGYISLKIIEHSEEAWATAVRSIVLDALDKITGQYEFSSLGENWIEVTRAQAVDVLEFALSHHPHMPYLKVRTPTAAHLMADMFVSAFGARARYFSNATVRDAQPTTTDWEAELPVTYMRIGHGEYDLGVVVLDHDQDGIFWVEDFV